MSFLPTTLRDSFLHQFYLFFGQPVQLINSVVNLRINNLYLPLVKLLVTLHLLQRGISLEFEQVVH
jgi:hypothetical protein